MAKYEITIDSIESKGFSLGSEYTISLHFKNKNGTFANDPRLPHGHRQQVVIDQLPFVVYFDFPRSGFYMSDIITSITISNDVIVEHGEIIGDLDLIENRLEVLEIESLC